MSKGDRLTVPLTEQMIDDIFEEAVNSNGGYHQQKPLFAIYRAAFPEWDDIRKLNGFPKVSKHTWKYIWRKFADLDEIHHPECLKGGAWFNSGFGGEDGLYDWVVYPIAESDILYRWQKNRVRTVYVDDWTFNERLTTRAHFVRPFQLGDTRGSFWNVTEASSRRLNVIRRMAQEVKLTIESEDLSYVYTVGDPVRYYPIDRVLLLTDVEDLSGDSDFSVKKGTVCEVVSDEERWLMLEHDGVHFGMLNGHCRRIPVI
jgi:hypothetical protein